jgi:hypothetical protein
LHQELPRKIHYLGSTTVRKRTDIEGMLRACRRAARSLPLPSFRRLPALTLLSNALSLAVFLCQRARAP